MKSILLSLSALLFIGCTSQPKPEIKDYSDKILKQREILMKAVKKSDELKYTYQDADYVADFSLIWMYGPNPGLNKDTLKLYRYLNKPTMFEGFGVKFQKEMLFKKLYPKTFNIDTALHDRGFGNFDDFFIRVYTFLTERDVKEVNKIINHLKMNHILPVDYNLDLDIDHFEKVFMAPYLYIGFEKWYIDNNIPISKEDMENISATMYLMSLILDSGVNVYELYGL